MKPEVVIARPRMPSKMDALKADNGRMHYGAGLKGSLCGVEVKHAETPRRSEVTCPDCVRELRKRP